MARPLLHPSVDDLKLENVLYALADPVRLEIVRRLAAGDCPLNCSASAPTHLAKSTLSHHFQILREAGLVRSERRGTEVVNVPRTDEIETRFPGVVSTILARMPGRITATPTSPPSVIPGGAQAPTRDPAQDSSKTQYFCDRSFC